MNKIIVDGLEVNYIVRKTTKKKIYIRVKENLVYVSVTKKTSVKDVERLIVKHIDFIKKELDKNRKEEVIHLNGIAYQPIFLTGNKNGVVINERNIIIISKQSDIKAYKKVLYDFYKKEVSNELEKIIDEAKCDFKEIVFPSISVRYMKSMFGNYNRHSHHIKLSSLLAKYDYSFIKLVLYHELSHVFEFNHSKKYYEIFERKYPNAKKLNFMLKKIKYHDCI